MPWPWLYLLVVYTGTFLSKANRRCFRKNVSVNVNVNVIINANANANVKRNAKTNASAKSDCVMKSASVSVTKGYQEFYKGGLSTLLTP